MPRYHNINGERVQYSQAEETARDVEEQTWADGQTGRDVIEAIATLEALETPRRLAEAFADPTWLNANRALIAIERAKL